ncbi:hypothetical protein HII36_35370 [Nonomuraea sp. NN258]|uniref:hypothetical protein n=1 Tax=Nonomuraea antri TaxID=2730852 RepID=UPI00156A1F39|nr:hypothetical protein [Nonomuraea antri]NRQ37081.1 hypothetical protein [Nonomuraea antri]
MRTIDGSPAHTATVGGQQVHASVADDGPGVAWDLYRRRPFRQRNAEAEAIFCSGADDPARTRIQGG